MKTSVRIVLVALLGTFLNPVSQAQTNFSQVQTLASSNNAFALDLYARLKATEGNIFFSPSSISTCLAMVYSGARGQTAAQMAQTLHFNAEPAPLSAAFSQLQQQLNSIQEKKEVQLDIANGLWSQKQHPFLPAFMDQARDAFQASLNQADFLTQSEPTRQQINTWVSDKTHGKIADLLPTGVVNTSTRLILVNAIYFKAAWAQPFRPAATANAPFHLAAGRDIEAPLMNQKAAFAYAETNNLQLIELPYLGNALSLVILLPKETATIGDLEHKLTEPVLNQWLGQTRRQRVDLFLPKFKVAAQCNLTQTLNQMGIKDAFTSSADFSGIDGQRDLLISAVIHKACVDLNEQGTEAAAATGAVMALTSARPTAIPVFRADHPFLYLIRDNTTRSILFMGRLSDPSHL